MLQKFAFVSSLNNRIILRRHKIFIFPWDKETVREKWEILHDVVMKIYIEKVWFVSMTMLLSFLSQDISLSHFWWHEFSEKRWNITNFISHHHQGNYFTQNLFLHIESKTNIKFHFVIQINLSSRMRWM